MLFCIASVCAKDIITKTDGTKIDAKVEEITESVIKYRKASNPTGPVYSISIESVYNIVYENGESEIFNIHNNNKDVENSKKSSVPTASEKKRINNSSTPASPVRNTLNSPSDDDLIRMSGNQESLTVSNGVSDRQLLNNELRVNNAKNYRKIGWIGGGIFLVAGVAGGAFQYYYNCEGATTSCLIGIAGAAAGAAWCLGFNLKANSMMREAREMQSYSATIIENEILHFGDKSVTAGINLMGNRMVNTHGLGLSIGLNF